MKGNLLSQPKPFYLIFFIEIWERFGFYGVQAIIVLFMVQNLNFSDAAADFLFTAFSALVFLLPAAGGYVADHYLGTKRTILLGAFILALGYLLLSLPFISNQFLELPLAIIAVGNGFFKANPSSLLSKVYKETGHNQDTGFTLYYMAINVGSLLSMVLVPVLSKYFGWHIGFACSFVGLCIAIINYCLMQKSIKKYGSKPDFEKIRYDYLLWVLLGAVVMVGVCYWLLSHHAVLSWILVIGAVLMVLFFLYETMRAKAKERKGMFLFIILFLQAIIFFVLYFQMPTSLTLFALRNVQHHILWLPMQPANFQALNPFWILVMSPILAAYYGYQTRRGKDWSLPSKFASGTLLAGLAFLALTLGAYFSKSTGIVNSLWVVLAYCLQSTGELLVSALGLALVSRFVPQRLMGYTMGLWFLSVSLASIIAGEVAALANVPHDISHDPRVSLPIYSHLFLHIGMITVAIAAVMFCFVPLLKRLIVSPRR